MPATPAFRRLLAEAFDAIPEGAEFVYRRTFTEGDVALFCGVTGDLNPLHQDDAFVRESFFDRRIVPGLLTGSMLTHIGGLLGFIAAEMSFEFLAPVYIGDTVTCTVRMVARDTAARRMRGEVVIVNEQGAAVLRATFSGLPSQVRLRQRA